VTDSSDAQTPSLARRIVSYFDPGVDGFIGRMFRLGAVVAAILLCVLASTSVVFFQSERGRHFVVYSLIDAGMYEEAAPRAAALVEDYPTARWEYYRLKALSLRKLDRVDESLATYQDAIAVMPDEWWAHSHLCFYTSLLTGDPSQVMDSCDRSIELDPNRPGTAYDRRAIARALVGDLDGAAADLELAIDLLEANDWWGYNKAQEQARKAWLEALRSGENPITEDELRMERQYY
jgi:tetratricopeptide (TPR) repeat protein